MDNPWGSITKWYKEPEETTQKEESNRPVRRRVINLVRNESGKLERAELEEPEKPKTKKREVRIYRDKKGAMNRMEVIEEDG